MPELDDLHHLRTILTTSSPLEKYRATPLRRQVVGDLILLELPAREALVLGPMTPAALLEHARGFYGDARLDGVELVVERAAAAEAYVKSQGWTLVEEEPALVLDPAPASLPSTPPELEIVRVIDEAGLADFDGVGGRARRHVPNAAAASDAGVAVLVGYVDGKPVASARLSRHGEVADLMGVNTIPERRRRGYGTAMTWAAIATARAMGCHAFLLTATEMGYPVYLKMGFRRIGTIRAYEPPS